MGATGTTPSEAARLPWPAIVAATLVGGGLRSCGLGDAPPWLDESATFVSLRHLGDRGADAPVFVQASNPLYYGLLWLWTQAFGTGAVALRSLSALAGTACIPLGAALAQRLGGATAARSAALLIALHPLHIHYSREARSYALWTLLGLAAIGALWRAHRRADRASWGLAALAWLASFGAHVFTLFALPATLAGARWSADARSALRGWLGFAAAVGLVAALYGLSVLLPALQAGAGAWLEPAGGPGLGALAQSLWALLPAGAYPGHLDGLSLEAAGTRRWLPDAVALAAAALPLAIVPIALVALRRSPGGASDWRPLAALALVPLALQWGVSWLRPTFLAGRYDLVAWPALTLWIALGIGALGRARPARAVVASLLLALCASVPIGRVLRYDGGDRWDARRAEQLAAIARPGDLAIVFSNDDDALAHGLHHADFAGALRPFPSWLARQIAFLDSPRDLSAERARDLARDAAALVDHVRATWAAGSAVYWLRDALHRDGRGARAILPERLEQHLASAGIERRELDPALGIDRLEPVGPPARETR